ncbi:efflux RND transporter periplasmic adaptor subunit [Thalassotalea maritima]|uniref:efflux RND transporter periplasmic adaptor subunit n=1 Tax=Thalassotalea maritima TaxID=3242416 RepID=UPI003527FB4B
MLMLLGCSEQNHSTNNEARYYQTVQAMPITAVPSYSVTRLLAGTIQSKQQAKLNFETSGKVASIYVDDGASVRRGDKLASLDTELFNIELQQLNALLQQNRADIELVNNNIRRLTNLAKQGYVSEQNIDELLTKQKVLIANKQQISAQIDAKRYQISRADIYAPFSGTINKRNIHIGEVISPQHIAFELTKNNQQEVKIGLPQQLAEQLATKNSFTIIVDGTEYVSDTVFINSTIDPISRTVQARFQLTTDIATFDNQLAYLQVQQEFLQSGYWIPLTALTDGVRGSWNVYTLQAVKQDSNEPGNATVDNGRYQVIHNSVEVIHTEQDKAFIRGDIDEHQLLLTSGLHRIVPGQLVYVQQGR